jgi:hypothetical protein
MGKPMPVHSVGISSVLRPKTQILFNNPWLWVLVSLILFQCATLHSDQRWWSLNSYDSLSPLDHWLATSLNRFDQLTEPYQQHTL